MQSRWFIFGLTGIAGLSLALAAGAEAPPANERDGALVEIAKICSDLDRLKTNGNYSAQSAEFLSKAAEARRQIAAYTKTHANADLDYEKWGLRLQWIYAHAFTREAATFEDAQRFLAEGLKLLQDSRPTDETIKARVKIEWIIRFSHAWMENKPEICASLVDETRTWVGAGVPSAVRYAWVASEPWLEIRLLKNASGVAQERRAAFVEQRNRHMSDYLVRTDIPDDRRARAGESWKQVLAEREKSKLPTTGQGQLDNAELAAGRAVRRARKATDEELRLVGQAGQGANPAAYSAAIVDFTTDDNWYRSASAAAGLSELLQAQLADETCVKWVERSALERAKDELKLSAFGFTDSASVLRIGKWAGADLMIAGHFFREPEKTQRVLNLEIIDLRSADVIVEDDLEISSDPEAPLALASNIVARAAASLRSDLRVALVRMEKNRKIPAIAPLFFGNTGKLGNIDFMEEDMIAALEREADKRGMRMLRFPRVRKGASERALAVGGLVETNAARWQNLADMYLWGSFAATNASGQNFEDAIVDYKLFTLRNDGSIGSIGATGTIATARDVLAKLALRVCEQKSSRINAGDFDEAVRGKICGVLLQQAGDMRKSFLSPAGSIENEPIWKQAARLTEVAAFFAPADERVRRARLLERWRNFQFDFWSNWKETEDWLGYLDAYGFAKLAEDPYGQNPKVEDNGVGALPGKPALAADAALNLLQHKSIGFPKDLPDDVYRQWRASLESQYVRLHAVAQVLPVAANMKLQMEVGLARLSDPKLRVAFCEAVYPAYARQGGAAISNELIIKAYTDAGLTESKALELIRRFPKKTAVDKQAEPCPYPRQSLCVPRRINVLPPQLPVELKTIPMPEDLRNSLVMALTWHAGRIWCSILHGAKRDSYSSGSLDDYCFDKYALNTLASYAPASNAALQRIDLGERSGPPSSIMGLQGVGEFLWLALANDGVWRLNANSRQVERFAEREGLGTRRLQCLAPVGDELLLFGGGDEARGVLSGYAMGSKKWKVYDPGAVEKTRFGVPAESLGRIMHLAAWKDWAVMQCQGDQCLLLNLSANSWTNASHLFGGFSAAAAEARGIWLGARDNQHLWSGAGQGGLVLFNPHKGKAEKKMSSVRGLYKTGHVQFLPYDRSMGRNLADKVKPKSRLPGLVTALADDGEFLWVATTTEKDEFDPGNSETDGFFLLLFHKPTERWVGYLRAPAKITTLALSAERVWIGMDGGRTSMANLDSKGKVVNTVAWWQKGTMEPLAYIEKKPLISIPESRWVSDTIPENEFQDKLAQLPPVDRARYAFLLGDYAKTVALLAADNIASLDVEALLLLGWSNDSIGLKKPDQARRYFQEVLQRNPHAVLKKMAEDGLKQLGP